MKKHLMCLAAAALPLLAQPALAKKVTRTVEYKDGAVTLEGYLVYDDEKVKTTAPALVVVHDWMGLTDVTRKSADQAAELGYVAFAADIYGKGVRPKDMQAAGAEAGKYKADRPLLARRVQLAVDAVRAEKNVNPRKVAASGYCFGGTAVLELARSGADIAGVVSFHGGLETPKGATAPLKPRVLVLHGADDPYVPEKEVLAFQTEMRNAKADWQFVHYSGAVHAFTNPFAGNDPSKGAAYNEVADRRSFVAFKSFLGELFAQ
ncbi:MAG: dienelactone hydrolase family protein [Bradymonadia bacterium]|jgi:dienelactone hydrolase